MPHREHQPEPPARRMRALATGLLALLGTFLFISAAPADVLVMKNGDRLTGKVKRMEAGKLVFRTSYAGTLTIDWGGIATLETDDPVTVVTTVEQVISGDFAPEEWAEGTIVIEQTEGPIPIELSEVAYVNPPPDFLGLGIRWHGDINLGLLVQRGNTDKDQYHVDGRLTGRGKVNRYGLVGNYNYEVNEGVNTVSDWALAGNLDRFLNKKLFANANLSLENNKFQDIRLRTTPSAGLGYQIWETDLRNLSVEGGLAFVDEQHYEGEDVDYWAGRWAVNLDYWVYRRVSQFFHTQTGRVSVDPTDRVIWKTRQGLRFPVSENLRTTLEFDYDLDTEPAAGVEEVDTKYLVTLGYAW